jgi:inosine-uridine nucleoside N-ribohydrolase
VLLDPTIATAEEWVVDVGLQGLTRSRPIKWRASELRMSAGLSIPDRSAIKILTAVDNEKLVKLMLSILSS